MAGHGCELARELRAARVALARLLLAGGAAAEARQVLSALADPPPALTLLSRLPGPPVFGVASGRNRARLALHEAAAFLFGLPFPG